MVVDEYIHVAIAFCTYAKYKYMYNLQIVFNSVSLKTNTCIVLPLLSPITKQ